VNDETEKKFEDMPVYDPMGGMGYGSADAFAESGSVVARAGEPLEAGQAPALEAEIGAALKSVYDPEIPVDIYELGLIYKIDIEPDGATRIEMSLTSPGCPVAGILPRQVAESAAAVPGVGEVEVVLVWDPPWGPEMMSEEAKVALGMF
jgi:FeS assembly SUF system protein